MPEHQPPKPRLIDVRHGTAPEDMVSQALQTKLDSALDHLALRYAQLPEQPQAEQETLQALKSFTRVLSDDELDWLAAAGPGVPGGSSGGCVANNPADLQNTGKPPQPKN